MGSRARIIVVACFGLMGAHCSGRSVTHGLPGVAGETSDVGGGSGRGGGNGGTGGTIPGGGGGTPTPGGGGKGAAGAGGAGGRQSGSSGRGGGVAGDGGDPGGEGGEGGQVEPGCGLELTVDSVDGLYASSPEDLAPLDGVSVLHGYLHIVGMEDASRLRCLRTIEGSLILESLGDSVVAGLSGLTSVTGNVVIRDVQSIRGLERLRSVGGQLDISRIGDSDLSGLAALTTVGANLTIVDTSVESLTGLSGLEQVDLGVSIQSNANLRTIGTLGSVTELEELSISGNPNLEDLHGLESLERVNEMLFVNGGELLTSLDGLGSIVEVGSLSVWGRVTDLRALSGLTAVTKQLSIISETLTDLEGLHNLESVGQGLVLTCNLQSFSGLRSLTSVGTTFIGDFGELPSFESLPQLTVGEEVSLRGGFLSLVGLDRMSFSGGLSIQSTQNLTTLAGLSHLTRLRELTLSDNQALVEVEGLENLVEVERNVTIGRTCSMHPDDLCVQNAQLTSLRGLRGLQSIGGGLVVTDNPVLPTCEAERLRDGIGASNIGGQVVIAANSGVATCAP